MRTKLQSLGRGRVHWRNGVSSIEPVAQHAVQFHRYYKPELPCEPSQIYNSSAWPTHGHQSVEAKQLAQSQHCFTWTTTHMLRDGLQTHSKLQACFGAPLAKEGLMQGKLCEQGRNTLRRPTAAVMLRQPASSPASIATLSKRQNHGSWCCSTDLQTSVFPPPLAVTLSQLLVQQVSIMFAGMQETATTLLPFLGSPTVVPNFLNSLRATTGALPWLTCCCFCCPSSSKCHLLMKVDSHNWCLASAHLLLFPIFCSAASCASSWGGAREMPSEGRRVLPEVRIWSTRPRTESMGMAKPVYGRG